MKEMEEIRNNKGNDRRVRELTVAGFNSEEEGSISICRCRMRSTSVKKKKRDRRGKR
jgi:hypothetical protein